MSERPQGTVWIEDGKDVRPDHPTLAQTVELDEATVLAVIAALEADDRITNTKALRIAKALLPKKDRAKELVEEWQVHEAMSKTVEPFTGEYRFARWLESEGRLA